MQQTENENLDEEMKNKDRPTRFVYMSVETMVACIQDLWTSRQVLQALSMYLFACISLHVSLCMYIIMYLSACRPIVLHVYLFVCISLYVPFKPVYLFHV